jgi:hypothetical protein
VKARVGSARIIPTSRGTAHTPALVAGLVHHAPAATRRRLMNRRASRKALSQLPGGRQLVTLKDAADYIMTLPKAAQNLPEWQTAIACLIGAAEGRDFLMHARIGVLRALNRDVERTFNSTRKDTHWGKRKLKRDQ